MNGVSEILSLVIVVLIPLLIIMLLFSTKFSRSKGRFICTTCRTVGEPVKKTKGSILIEITFWLCFLIPGLIYSLWRETTKYKACPACGNSTMISIKTPLGQELQNKLSETIPAQKADQGLAEYKARIIL